MLDVATLRVAFGVVALTLVFLFTVTTHRGPRSAYSRWWSLALILFLAGSAAYLFNGTPHQVWANPLGNALLVAGAADVWAGARSLRLPRPEVWPLVAAPVVAFGVASLDHPATNVWSGGAAFLALMSLMIGLASYELSALPRSYSRVRRPMFFASATFSAYYFLRLVAFMAEGPDGATFRAYFGSAVTTLVTMVLLVVVSFSMAALSNEQRTRDLNARAMHDSLTGLLNRAGFIEAATDTVRQMQREKSYGSLILADLDHFKSINDTYGHPAGDDVLQVFAGACMGSIRATDVVGRYGGEEFILLLPTAGPDRAQEVVAEISRKLTAAHADDPRLDPTASYGIASFGHGITDLNSVIASADSALYRAKALGRNRSEHGLPQSI
ncbi:GGDEF domain-containing protein [Cryobacterium tepidiphilum]|uniref:GGDEF domain-containing protein n=1 Tax=Cryobacterium tepidiphilum TaxID=2486026 RepID=A0A3M8LMU9_9MICO|nr:GGDEF domain-containing protein [Cryobacterium tepidiphilum]RNE66711.1 GGDEF domain-containing protein [Cryobacterium tepidiphilum]